MADLQSGTAGWDDQPVDVSSGVIRMPIPGPAFVPFPSDTFRTTRRLAHTVVSDRGVVARQLAGQAIEELGRTHLALCIAPGVDCDECFWISKAVAAVRAPGWLR